MTGQQRFARYYRDTLITRACRRAVRRLGRALTSDEHALVRLTVRSFLPTRRRQLAITPKGRQYVAAEEPNT